MRARRRQHQEKEVNALPKSNRQAARENALREQAALWSDCRPRPARPAQQEAGHVALTVSAPDRQGGPEELRTWLQVTRIGIDALADGEALIGWATDLGSGRPLASVELWMLPGVRAATTGADGLARVPLDSTPGTVLVARRGLDVAILPESVCGRYESEHST